MTELTSFFQSFKKKSGYGTTHGSYYFKTYSIVLYHLA